MTTNNRPQTVFLTGATGAMGLAITKALTEAGHTVLGVTRSESGVAVLRSLGATPVVVDLFDGKALTEAMRGADAVAHFATSIPAGLHAAKVSSWRMNDRLRIEGTRNLIAAAETNGVPRFIFESYAGAYPDQGEQWIDESLPFEPVWQVMQSVVQGEALVNRFGERGGKGVVLRFGGIYGPGRASDPLIALAHKRQFPIVGSGKNYMSTVHVDDVGSAVLHALTVAPGTYNVVDDEPMRQSYLFKLMTESVGAPPPRRLPYWLVRVMAGGLARVATVSQRISNRRFREATGWRPRYPSAREGWAAFPRPAAAPADLVTPVAAR